MNTYQDPKNLAYLAQVLHTYQDENECCVCRGFYTTDSFPAFCRARLTVHIQTRAHPKACDKQSMKIQISAISHLACDGDLHLPCYRWNENSNKSTLLPVRQPKGFGLDWLRGKNPFY
ncbi:hypothetical protein AMECASPLE_006675 [Ameca splendens]|uniref:Uncharacterized protein n=1 Tax=Ameca splendens TaxID=208324 RepID=A0ABV0Z948_9TELE